MRENFTLYPVDEAVSVRSYIHETGKGAEFHDKGVKLMESFLHSIADPGQKIMNLFRDFKKAMAAPQHLGSQRTSNADVTSTMRNIMREIYGKKFDSIDVRMSEVEEHLIALEQLLQALINEDVTQSIGDLGKSQRQLRRERPPGVTKRKPVAKDPAPTEPHEDLEHELWTKSLPAEGTPEWDKWVAMRANHIQQQKERAYRRGDTTKGDDLHGHDWWDHKAHWQQAHDEIGRYVKSGKDNKKFAWSKHYNDWRGYIGHAINEYYDLKAKQDEQFFKSIMPPKPKAGYM